MDLKHEKYEKIGIPQMFLKFYFCVFSCFLKFVSGGFPVSAVHFFFRVFLRLFSILAVKPNTLRMVFNFFCR